MRAVIAGALLLGACSQEAPQGADKAADDAPLRVVEVRAVFETTRDTVDNIDSPAVWHGPDGQHWLISTAKETDVLVVNDARTGAFVRRVGGPGRANGQMDRPNGIAVIDDLLWLVERDNRRLQVFRLPGFESLGTFGEAELTKPYGIAIRGEAPGTYALFVTDNYELVEDSVPPDSALGRRVRQYRVAVTGNTLRPQLVRTFGDTSGAGVLRVVESIALDPANSTLIVAEEQEGASMLKVYDQEGKFTGRIIESRYFPNQAEGIVLYACADGGGYWIATDQGMESNTFHVFQRGDLNYLGSFRAPGVLNTDGIAITQRAFDNYPAGAFYAVHNDGNVAGFSLGSIAEALGLRADCTLPARS